MAWPPTLPQLKDDMGIAADDVRDDDRLQVVLDAAVGKVEEVRPDFNYSNDPLSEAPLPSDALVLGTVRLAGRWHTRRRSPDGLITADQFGSTRVPSFDPDIERLLGIGRYRGPVVA